MKLLVRLKYAIGEGLRFYTAYLYIFLYNGAFHKLKLRSFMMPS